MTLRRQGQEGGKWQVFAGDSKQVAALLPVDRGLGGSYVVGDANFDLDEAQDVVATWSAGSVRLAIPIKEATRGVYRRPENIGFC